MDEGLFFQLAAYVIDQFPGVLAVLRLQIDSAFVRKDNDGPQAVRQLVPEFRLAVVDVPDTRMRLDQFRQIADVAHETKRQFLRGPGAAIQLGFELFVELVELHGRFFEIYEVHVDNKADST